MAENETTPESTQENKEEKQSVPQEEKRGTEDLTREQLEALRRKLHKKFH